MSSVEAEVATGLALAAGIRHIDTSHSYRNQDGVGRALKTSGMQRSDEVFVTSKIGGCGTDGLSLDDCGADTRERIRETLRLLDVASHDLLLVDYPPGVTLTADGATMNTDCLEPAHCAVIQQQWAAFEDAFEAGETRAIGVSNFCDRCLSGCLLKTARIVPQVSRLHFHFGMGPDPEGVLSASRNRGITVQAYSPLGGFLQTAEIGAAPAITAAAARLGKTPFQVALRWVVDHGAAFVVASDDVEHLALVVEIFGWNLSEDELKAMDAVRSPMSGVSTCCSDSLGTEPQSGIQRVGVKLTDS